MEEVVELGVGRGGGGGEDVEGQEEGKEYSSRVRCLKLDTKISRYYDEPKILKCMHYDLHEHPVLNLLTPVPRNMSSFIEHN